MKKKLIVTVSLSLLLIAIYLTNNTLNYSDDEVTKEIVVDNTKIVTYGFGSYKKYDNLEALEDEAELIIIGTVINDLNNPNEFRIKTSKSDPIGEAWINSSIKVNKIIKGKYYDTEITVSEPLFVEDNVIYSIHGYSPLQPSATYVLFLAKSEFGAGSEKEFAWNTLSLNFGKYNTRRERQY